MSEVSPYKTPETLDANDFEQEQLICSCEILLGSGKGHTSIIHHLRKNGHTYEDAKKLSYFYFDAAKKRLIRSQLVTILLANGLIVAGIALPIVLYFLSARFIIVSAFPIVFGLYLKSKIINPSRLPENGA